MNVVKLLLFPFTVLYDVITRIRNYLYDIGHKSAIQFDITVIGVGNLNVGGSGKTPMIEYLIELLKKNYKVATLSRGFRRRTHGYRIATEGDNAKTLGDEPFQLYQKFKSEIKVAVSEDRALAIPNILHEFPETKVVLLDDAFQHRAVQPQLSILLTEYANPFYNDHVLPGGRLRESRSGAKRADVIVVTKCANEISQKERDQAVQRIQKYAGSKPVFFSHIQYQAPVPISRQNEWSDNIVLISGIAKPETILSFCKSNYNLIKHFNFEDHHNYTSHELGEIKGYCKSLRGPYAIVTTEKDMVKMIATEFEPFIDELPWFYIPIRHVFLEGGMNFDKLALNAVDPTR